MKQKIFFLTIIAVLCVLLVNNCSNKNATIQRQEDNIKALKDSTKYFKNKLNETVATKLALQLTEKELKEEKKTNERLQTALKDFKKTIATIQSKQEVRIDTIKIPYKEEVECIFSRFQTIKKPYYTFDLLSNEKGNTIANFRLTDNKQDIVIGYKKKNFFSNSELRVDITNSNALFNQKEIKPIIIVYKKSWYEKPQITIPLGFTLAILANQL